ncbi:uncharacterized protein [Dysidea avara]|uniref:uncharacterized protein isoform X2 n=1 Tax=Dysidea avara TaxID=196820 RepID=UPI00332F4198
MFSSSFLSTIRSMLVAIGLIVGCAYITVLIFSSSEYTTARNIESLPTIMPFQFREYKLPEGDDDKESVPVVPHLLSQQTMDRIKKYVFFIGHPHSGHSIVGAIIDSHPHVVLAHEADIFTKVRIWKECDRKKIFKTIWNTARTGKSLQRQTRKGYTLTIDNLYQGTYQDYIDVIGDKKGGTTTALLYHYPEQWGNVYHRLKAAVNLPIKVFHVIRNPYDNIASLVLAKYSSASEGNDFGKLRVSNETNSIDSQLIDKVIENYFGLFQAIETAKQKYNLNMLQVYGSDLVADPKITISKLFKFLEVSVSDELVDVCSRKVFEEDSKLRYKIQWQDEHISTIKKQIKKFSNLKRNPRRNQLSMQRKDLVTLALQSCNNGM